MAKKLSPKQLANQFKKGKSGNPNIGKPGATKRNERFGRALAIQLVDDIMSEDDTYNAMLAKLRKEAKNKPASFIKNILMPMMPRSSIEEGIEGNKPIKVNTPLDVTSMEDDLKKEMDGKDDAVTKIMEKAKKPIKVKVRKKVVRKKATKKPTAKKKPTTKRKAKTK